MGLVTISFINAGVTTEPKSLSQQLTWLVTPVACVQGVMLLPWEPLKPLCQQQEPSWTPMSLPTLPQAESCFINCKSAVEIAVTVYLCCHKCVTRWASAREQLTWLSESQPNFPWWCLRVGWALRKLGWWEVSLPLAGELELDGLKVPSNLSHSMILRNLPVSCQ